MNYLVSRWENAAEMTGPPEACVSGWWSVFPECGCAFYEDGTRPDTYLWTCPAHKNARWRQPFALSGTVPWLTIQPEVPR